MLEHAFYQMLNLWQALYLHAITWMGSSIIIRKSLIGRMVLLWIVTLPWVVRRLWFPVNSFSANWISNNQQRHNGNTSDRNNERIQVGTKSNERSQSSINRVYQIKKWQYVFYKHVILHGLNISMAVISTSDNHTDNLHRHPLPLTTEWRIFWLCLNTSYVMEFFLQSMVKRGVFSQQNGLLINGLLMISSSLAAIGAVFGRVRIEAAVISLLLNFINRGHDVLNTMIAAGCIVAYTNL